MRLRVMLVDDEPIARKVLREELELMADIELIAEAETGAEAIRRIEALSPDVVFLDLQMPGQTGFDVIRALNLETFPSFVIVTAYDEYAVEAFQAGALDYLLKPVSADRLALSVARVRQYRGSPRFVGSQMAELRRIAGAAPEERPRQPRKVVGRAGEEYHLLDVQDVLAFQAEREVVRIVTKGNRYLASQPLKDLEARLSGLNFARIHRSVLVNLDHVAKMAPLSSQRWLLTLTNGQQFIVSKRNAKAIQTRLTAS
ncbi:MAG: LytTR family DNA-binding domain-containing protein [Bryobacteraceae bacterium]